MARHSLSLLGAACLPLLLLLLPRASAGPEPVHDFANMTATAADFVVRDFTTNLIKFPAGAFAATGYANLPGVETLGLAGVTVTIAVNGMLTPHWHPRASEIMLVIKGKVRVNFIDGTNVLRSSDLNTGDLHVYPRALLHWMENIGTEPCMFFSALDSEDPGLILLNQVTKVMSNRVVKAVFQTKRATAEHIRNVSSVPLVFFK